MSENGNGILKYIPVSRKRWFELMVGRRDRDIMLSGRYTSALRKLPEGEKTKASGLTLRAEIKNWSEIMVSDSELIRKARTEDGYNIYCLDHTGVPSLMGCTEGEYSAMYLKSGELKRPTYVV